MKPKRIEDLNDAEMHALCSAIDLFGMDINDDRAVELAQGSLHYQSVVIVETLRPAWDAAMDACGRFAAWLTRTALNERER